MDDASFFGPDEGVGNLASKVSGFAIAKGTVAFEVTVQILAINVRHDEVMQAGAFADVDDGDDVGMAL